MLKIGNAGKTRLADGERFPHVMQFHVPVKNTERRLRYAAPVEFQHRGTEHSGTEIARIFFQKECAHGAAHRMREHQERFSAAVRDDDLIDEALLVFHVLVKAAHVNHVLFRHLSSGPAVSPLLQEKY